METHDSPGPLFLLEDYRRSLGRRLARLRSEDLPSNDRPLWLSAGAFSDRVRWQFRKAPGRGSLGPSDVPTPGLLTSRFDPARRLREVPGARSWTADADTDLELDTEWRDRGQRSARLATGAMSVVLHSVGISLLMIPAARQLDFTKPADWDSMRFTLMAPDLEDLPPLTGRLVLPGRDEQGVQGLPQPTPEPAPGIEEETVEPEEPEDSEVVQPIEPEEPEPVDETPALEESEEPEAAELPEAQSPAPDAFRTGSELAQARDPRLLPMPAAPSRKRAALQLENPKAAMPGRRGDAQLGALDLTPRPGQVIEGAIQQMMRGGGVRQAVGDGIGGSASAGILPSTPTRSGSLVELLSDPRGVDFRPYLTQILAAVRRNWFAVIPESARLGMTRGRTLIQFSVARNGSVPKLVIARSSGAPPLDRAAVAGISASNPFPPLPGEYIGNDIRLQFTFLYNIRTP